MITYTCDRCNYNTNFRGNFKRHLFKVNVCHPKTMNVPIETIRIKYGFDKIILSEHKVNTKRTQSEHKKNIKRTIIEKNEKNETNKTNKTNNLMCKHCGKHFKYATSKYRHVRKYCNQKNIINIVEDLKKQVKELKANNNSSITNNTVNNNNNTSNNTVNDNSNNINITINGFGKEDLSYITDKKWCFLLNKCWKSVKTFVKEIHFNPKHPDNQNVCITNRKLPFADLHIDGEWLIQDKKEVVNSVLTNAINTLDLKFEEILDQLTNSKQKYFRRYQEKRNIEKQMKILTQETELAILNGTKKKTK